ncbi:diaminopimelate epimerase [Portibacter lacus]|uniref:Diaminopimelate epimerase n=1 Tax=Portibacter lacus TaxID=1099794 RepID=A0AA37WE30_9BACT|nr:diaminopimelate epimerase [Portibacter lacus]GLR15705.1 diaminopimelate epimerase [Portibacter lacus]
MEYKFWKYQGTGNDFIFLDGRNDVSAIKDNTPVIARLCDRKFGIGADGLIILEEGSEHDFRMVYYNSDGSESTMCGNGGRCAIAFAKFIGLAKDSTVFDAIDGKHAGEILEDGWVELGMINVSKISNLKTNVYEMNTGSPHYVQLLKKGEALDIVDFGRKIRYNDQYKAEGINVNAAKMLENGISVETYERGVEDETLSCGTGVTACAIAYNEFMGNKGKNSVDVMTKGGQLKVSFMEKDGQYFDIVLSGPAVRVFEGVIGV